MIKKLLVVALIVVAVAMLWPAEQFNPDLVSGRRVLVTGASSGIGEQLAYQYAKAGASVFITARREELLTKVVDKCRELGSAQAQFGYLPADMADMDQTTQVIEAAVNHLGGLDHVILNHAYIPYARPWTATQQNYDVLKKTLDVNMRSFAHLAVQALPYLKTTNGSLGVVSSITGKIGMPLFSTYSASKFALDGFFSAFREEVSIHNVSITLCVLGGIGTDQLQSTMNDIIANYELKTKKDDRKFSPADPSECAYEIMRGTTMREREVYFPPGQYIRQVVLFRDLVVRFGLIGGRMKELLNRQKQTEGTTPQST